MGLGECVGGGRLLRGEIFEWLRLVDGHGGDSLKYCESTATTRLQWARGVHDWLDAFVAGGGGRRLRALEGGKRAEEVAGFWAQMRPAAGQKIASDHAPEQPPTARLL